MEIEETKIKKILEEYNNWLYENGQKAAEEKDHESIWMAAQAALNKIAALTTYRW